MTTVRTAGAISTTQAPRVFESDDSPADGRLLALLEDRVRDADLVAPPVVLPDFLHKEDMEMPSSITVATRDTIRSTFTSSSVNCGMALIALDIDRPPIEAIGDFYQRVRERYPWPPRRRLELSTNDVLRCAKEGAAFAVDRFGLDAQELERIEEGGCLDVDRYGGAERVGRELPWMTRQLARMRFGTIGPSNHFIELQQVEEVFDAPVAARLGVHVGQLTLQYHGGGGVLAGQVGRLFGRRQKISRTVRWQMAVQKPMHHFGSARSLDELRLRKALYFASGVPIPRNGPEGERFMLANAAAMNYGFAFRAATYAGLMSLANQAFGPTGGRLIVDSPHNSIYEEEVDGASAIVHRHNSCRAYPASRMNPNTVFGEVGQATLLPGTSRTSSYLCVADDGASESLYSACHGAGSIISDFADSGRSQLDPRGRTTVRFGYSDEAPSEVPQLDDRGVDEALAILTKNGLSRPVARLRPLAVLR
jgi:tRNA-splicing ligase RtcB (3'-phosphate/5'-hydroxy nucleic acid ligase)